MTLDLDSTIVGVSSKDKQGAAYGHTGKPGYHPLSAFRADTGEIVAARLRGGSSQRGASHFAAETIRRIRRAGAAGPVTVRADAGFWSYDMFNTLDRLGVGWSVTIPRRDDVKAVIALIGEDAWVDIDYPDGGRAQVAETVLAANRSRTDRGNFRLVVRRTRLLGRQAQLWPDRRYHTFVTNLDLPAVEADRYHRQHAVCELAIRDLKGSAGLAHLPSGDFAANAARLACAALAHNLYRWIALLGGTRPDGRLTVGETIRRRLFGIPGRLVNHSRKLKLRLPARWPWADTYHTTLHNLRNLPQPG